MNKDDVLRIANEVEAWTDHEQSIAARNGGSLNHSYWETFQLEFASRLQALWEAEWMKDAEPVAEVGSVQGQTLYAFTLNSTIPSVGTKLYLHPAPIPEDMVLTDEQLTEIYNKANGIEGGKNTPITTQKIFAAMRAMIAAAQGGK